jgi:ABC-type multidrug transport system fused ATPase/permease subunit
MIINYLITKFFENNKAKVIFYIVLVLFIFTMQSVGVPILFGNLFKQLNVDKTTPFKFTDVPKYLKSESARRTILILIVIWFFMMVFNYFKNMIECNLVPRYMSYLRGTLFDTIIDKYSDKYEDIKIGDTLGRIMDISRNMKDCFQLLVTSIFPQSIAIIIIACFLCFYNKKLGLMILGLTVVYFISMYWNSNNILDTATKREYNFAIMNEKLSDNFSNLMNIYINNQQGDVKKKNSKLETEYSDIYTKEFSLHGKLNLSQALIVFIVTFVAFMVGYIFVTQKTLAKEQFITIIIIMSYYVGYNMQLSVDLPIFLTKLGVVIQSRDFLKNLLVSNIKKILNSKNNATIGGNIEFRNVSFKYPNAEKYILNNLSVKVKKGEKLGVLGKSGSGKTTIMKLILKMYKPNSGTILIENEDVEMIDTGHLRENITYVNQRTTMFNETVIENLKYGNDLTDKEIIAFLKKYGLDTLYEKLDKKINTMAGVNGNNLSLGMQKVIFICRGIFRKSNIIIFDEPLAGLDKITREKILKMITAECNDKTIIVITHDKEIIPYMTRIVHMDELANMGTLSDKKEKKDLDTKDGLMNIKTEEMEPFIQ